jgi:3-deoxy-D-manno-octulosonic-acid transferase
MIQYLLYNFLLLSATPAVVAYLIFNRKYRLLLRRFHPFIPFHANKKRIWVHACSVGEILAVKKLIEALKRTYPERDVLLSVSTLSGYTLAQGNFGNVQITFAPFDLRFCVRSFVRRLNPVVLVLMETEIWPNLVRETRKQGSHVVIVNGRLSQRKYPLYKKYKAIMPPVLSWISHAAVQEDTYRKRFQALGIPLDKITVTGNLKCDGVITEVSENQKQGLRQENGFSIEDVIMIFGSTRPGDEVLAFSCWQALKMEYPKLKLIIAPRHLQRLKEGLAVFIDEEVLLRSEIKKGKKVTNERVLFLDTMGELNVFYAICGIAVIGGSFFPGVEGHNPLEPAALGIPTVFGPYMGNFPDAVSLLKNSGGALQVSEPDALLTQIKYLLDHPDAGRSIGESGRLAVIDSQGATARTVALIDRFMD